MANLGDQAKLASMRFWSLHGPNRIVKVMGLSADNYMRSSGKTISGYVTQEKYLYGMTNDQIERHLGLRTNELRPMARIYALQRLPTADEVEFKFSAAFPDGKPVDDQAAFDADLAQSRDNLAAGKNLYNRSMTPAGQFYPPGSGMIPQWKLIAPVPSGQLIATVTDQFAFPRANGSVKPFTPHNKGTVS